MIDISERADNTSWSTAWLSIISLGMPVMIDNRRKV